MTLFYTDAIDSGCSTNCYLDTSGGTAVVITGTGFGLINWSGNVATVYGHPSSHYTSSDSIEYSIPSSGCSVSTDQTVITCTTLAGVGTNTAWTVTVGDQTSTVKTSTISYAAPTISSVTIGSSGTTMTTNGGETVTITGTNYGPTSITATVIATYGTTGTEYTATSCARSSNTEITCTTVAGVGASLQWIVNVAGQPSVASTSVTTSYGPPAITSVSVHGQSTGYALLTTGMLVCIHDM